jgi:hypothetical protein
LPFHPFLFWLYPLLFFYSHNRNELFVSDIALPLLVCVLCTAAVYGLFYLTCRNSGKAALITSLYALLFFSYGHLRAAVFPDAAAVAGPGRVLIPVFVLTGIVIPFVLIRTGKTFRPLNTILNYTAVALVIFPLFQTVKGIVQSASAPNRIDNAISVTDSIPRITEQSPDIYYLIFDRYPSFANLKKYMQFDNKAFEDFLIDKGFTVSESAFSNYPYTYLSLAATLNMSYLDEIGTLKKGPPYRKKDMYRQLTHNRVVSLASRAGYRCLNIGSWFEPTRVFPDADENYADGYAVTRYFGLQLKEPMVVFLRTTLLGPLLARFYPASHEELHRRIVDEQMKAVEDACGKPGPTFTAAHILLPHAPYVFRKDGSAPQPGENLTERDAFLEQLQYGNTLVRRIVTAIFKNSDRGPVIILQADEGCYDCFGNLPPDEEIPSKMGILYAHYFPRIGDKTITPPESPVNTFPVVFNNYLNTGFKIRKNRYFFPALNDNGVSDMAEVTGRLKELLSGGTIDTEAIEEEQ